MEDERPIDAPDVPLGRGVNAEMGEVFFEDGEFGGGGCGCGNLVVFCTAVLDGYFETFDHSVGRARHRGVQLGIRVVGYVMGLTT